MARKALGALALLPLWMNSAAAQEFPPGYVDPWPLLAAAAEEIGEANLRCITFSGNGYSGAVGQTFENAVNVDWPRIGNLINYTRSINWRPRPASRPSTANRASVRPRGSTAWVGRGARRLRGKGDRPMS